MIETKKFGVIPSPFDERVIALYKKVDDAVMLGQTVELSRGELCVIRDALHLAMPMPLLVCNFIDEDENGAQVEKEIKECPTCGLIYSKRSAGYRRRCSNCGQTFKLEEEGRSHETN